MKKTLSVLLAVLMMVLSLAGCQKEPDKEKTLLEQIKERGYIIVGTEGTYFPNSYHDESGKLTGFDVEVAALVAKYMGVEVQYYETEWASIFTALDTGKIDTIVNECGWKEERAVKYEFSNPYTYVQGAIMTRNDNDTIHSLEDLNGKVAANESTSLLGEMAQQYGATLDAVNAMAQSISEVVNGRADCTLNYVTSFAAYMKENPDAPVKIAVLLEANPTAYIPVLKGETDLINAINDALKKASDSGELTAISMKYFDVDVTKG
ncbi:MAG: transporter substrate-binding domain-containing protein [Erysipelotrichaceae bacterium]|nr:transporter substrate-binding domain-containing protein [Erysipelotrichaceae bacterium]